MGNPASDPPLGAARKRESGEISPFDGNPSGFPTKKYAVLEATTMAPPALEEPPIVVMATKDASALEVFRRRLPGASVVAATDADEAFEYGALGSLRAIVLDVRGAGTPVWLPDDFPSRALLVIWGGDEGSLVGDHAGEKLPCDGATGPEDVAQLTGAFLGIGRR